LHQARLAETVTIYNPVVRDDLRALGRAAGGTQQGIGIVYGEVLLTGLEPEESRRAVRRCRAISWFVVPFPRRPRSPRAESLKP
jgi:hypothetical protein